MTITILNGDCREVLKTLPDESVHCVVTSPPYFGLRDYGHADQIGLETTPDAFVAQLVSVFHEVRRVLKDSGTVWLNLGDSYNNQNSGGNGATGGRDKSTLQSKMPPVGTTPVKKKTDALLKPKDLLGIPWRVAFALQADGWYLRQDIIWAKPNPMPESVTDRCTKAHEYIFMLTKSARYFYDADAIAEDSITSGETRGGGRKYSDDKSGVSIGGSHNLDKYGATPETRNKRSVWTVATKPFADAHFATFPPALIEPCILAGCPAGGVVLDPFGGAGTTGLVADRHGRSAILIELNEAYATMARNRIKDDSPLFADVPA